MSEAAGDGFVNYLKTTAPIGVAGCNCTYCQPRPTLSGGIKWSVSDPLAYTGPIPTPMEVGRAEHVAIVTESARRKAQPLFQGCLMYFPDALLAVAEHSRKANDKHNPGEKLHWSKDKSKDHADCIARHLLDIGQNWDAIDPEFGSYHAAALAWRALALLQTVLEREHDLRAIVQAAAERVVPR